MEESKSQIKMKILNSKIENWEVNNSLIASCILNSVDPSISRNFDMSRLNKCGTRIERQKKRLVKFFYSRYYQLEQDPVSMKEGEMIWSRAGIMNSVMADGIYEGLFIPERRSSFWNSGSRFLYIRIIWRIESMRHCLGLARQVLRKRDQ